jgi:hypothetical protein
VWFTMSSDADRDTSAEDTTVKSAVLLDDDDEDECRVCRGPAEEGYVMTRVFAFFS